MRKRKFTKKILIHLLAADRIKQYPGLYAGHHEDAIKYWENNGGNLDSLIVAAAAHGLIDPHEVQKVYAKALRHRYKARRRTYKTHR